MYPFVKREKKLFVKSDVTASRRDVMALSLRAKCHLLLRFLVFGKVFGKKHFSS